MIFSTPNLKLYSKETFFFNSKIKTKHSLTWIYQIFKSTHYIYYFIDIHVKLGGAVSLIPFLNLTHAQCWYCTRWQLKNQNIVILHARIDSITIPIQRDHNVENTNWVKWWVVGDCRFKSDFITVCTTTWWRKTER